MENKIFLVFISIFIFLILVSFLFLTKQPPKKWGRACFQEYCFDVKLAQNGIEKTKGLMFQKYLEQNKGMLFFFDKESIYPFWMKNTYIPLDIIWMNKNYKVVFISENNQPCKWHNCPLIEPPTDAKYVLEVNSGIVQKIRLKLADELNLTY
ncbi:MAG: DUF192 domain-containing protein [Candidatus Staskawiczbacteria bacterium]|nr:DUF192 domain-containing protein [Candidatus Staskawiczbacteria bacterium]